MTARVLRLFAITVAAWVALATPHSPQVAAATAPCNTTAAVTPNVRLPAGLRAALEQGGLKVVFTTRTKGKVSYGAMKTLPETGAIVVRVAARTESRRLARAAAFLLRYDVKLQRGLTRDAARCTSARLVYASSGTWGRYLLITMVARKP